MDIIPRTGWGAIAPRGPIYSTPRSSRTGFVVHHGVGPGGNSPAEAQAILRGYQRLHHGRGYHDIGYNFAVDKWGNIYNLLGIDAIGAHAGGANTANIGAVLIGDSRNGDLTPEAQAAFQRLYAWCNEQTGKQLAQRVHSDINATACPGDAARDWVKGGGLTGGGSLPSLPPRPPKEAKHNGYLVREIQTLLTRRGFPTAIDGIYGPHTTQQVRAFQKQQRITVDGIVGPVTWSHLNVPVQPVKRPTIRRGSTGKDVRYAQQRLGGLTVDGVFGPRTEERVKEFQRREKITVDGIIGPQTWNRLG